MLLKTSRRTFLKGLTLSGVAGSLGVWSFNARSSLSLPVAASLQGTQFDLTIGETAVNITGSERQAKTINGGLPGPVLRWKEGDTITLKVKNRLNEQTSIHWHGIILPANMDGVPGLSFMGIEPDDTYVYTFKVKQNGTYWYHSHSGLQEQEGVYGAIIIDAREPEPFAYDREHVVMLSDWTDENPHSLLKKLKKQSDYYNFNKPTVGSFFRDVNTRGLSATIADRKMWAEMKMNPTDLADVSGYTYTYLMNGQAPRKNWTGLFRPGEKIRLRFINGSAMTYFDIRIPGLKMTVVAADGQYVNPVIKHSTKQVNKMSILNKAILTGGLVMGVAFSAMAHPELKSSVPQADSAVAAPEKIQLNFSENLTVKFSGAKLTMTGMKGMSSHSPMPVAAKVAPGADPKSMVIIPREPLPAGTYRVDWRAVSSDTHPITGNYTFTVK